MCDGLHVHAELNRDPTRTTTLRQRFEGEAGRRFRNVAGIIREAVVTLDVLGLKGAPRTPQVNRDRPGLLPGQFDFASTPQKVGAFMRWLNEMQRKQILDVTEGEPIDSAARRAWTSKYIHSAYQKGIAHSAQQMRKAGAKVDQQWVTAAFNRPIHADRVGLIYTRTYKALEGITQAMDTQISRELAQGLAEGVGPEDMARRLANRVDKIGRTRARVLARTECLPGDTLVDRAVVRAAFRRWYDGPMVKVTTRSGRQFSATPNHPMLTENGWVGAGSIQVGDNLVRDAGQQNVGSASDPNENHRPAPISEIFGAASRVGVFQRKRSSPLDFHGDGADGNVDVFLTGRPLMVGTFTPVTEPFKHLIFTESGRAATAFCHTCGGLLAIDKTTCLACRSKLNAGIREATDDGSIACPHAAGDAYNGLSSLVARNNLVDRNVVTPLIRLATIFPRKALSLRSVTKHAAITKKAGDTLRVIAKSFCAFVTRQAGLVSGNNLVGIFDLVPNAQRVGSSAGGASLSQPLADGCLSDTERLGDSSGGFAGDVALDDVVSVEVYQFAGHVYNLETECGYFNISSFYTGNTINAHAEATLNSYSEAGIEGVSARAEFSTAGDGRVCERCQALEGDIYAIDEARGLIPVHPQCRCAWLPHLDDLKGVSLR